LVFYEVFTGRRAFTATTAADLRRLYAEGTASKPSNHVGGLDLAVERAILRCLGRGPADRPRSAHPVPAGRPRGGPRGAPPAGGRGGGGGGGGGRSRGGWDWPCWGGSPRASSWPPCWPTG